MRAAVALLLLFSACGCLADTADRAPVKNIILRHESDLADHRFFLDIMGRPARAVFRRADDSALHVEAMKVPFALPWQDIDARRLVRIAEEAARTCDERIAIIRFAGASGLSDDAARLLAAARSDFPDRAADLDGLAAAVAPQDAPAEPAAKLSQPEEKDDFKSSAPSAGGSVPGEILSDPGTFHSLSLRWPVGGDEDADASVQVAFRKKGESAWRQALPLFRCETEALIEKPPKGSTMFAGSVLNLVPDTEYEIRLRLIDPDGGNTQRVLSMRTWKEPLAPAPKRILHVVPGGGGGTGSAGDPFRGTAAADAASRPGDLLLLHKGVYRGTLDITKDGQPGAPVVWRGAGDGEAIIDASGNQRGVSASERRHIFLEDFTVRNPQYGIVMHRAADFVIRRINILGVHYGVACHADAGVQQRILITDCIMKGPSVWPREKGIEGARGVQITGIGNVVCYNRISCFADAIDTFHAQPVRAVDIHNNDCSILTDDGIETDYSEQNVRCFHNRITNAFQGISLQPVYGGPVYVFRNAVYGIEAEPYKLHNSPSGGYVMHNTTVTGAMAMHVYSGAAPVRNTVYRNNLMVGGASGNYFVEITTPMLNCDFDYNAYVGGPFKSFVKWSNTVYGTHRDLVDKSGQERHGLFLNTFRGLFQAVQVPIRDVRAQAFPMEKTDLRLAPKAPVIDKGVVLPNVNDGFKGAAPDIGCYELDDELPHYGPRARPSPAP